MDAVHVVAALSALEAATDALLVAVGRLPEPDLRAAAAALSAREAALRFLARADPAVGPPDVRARLVRVLERDEEATRRLRGEMAVIGTRLGELAGARAGEATSAARRYEEFGR